MRILGIDPGLRTCGFALLSGGADGAAVLDLGVWVTSAEGTLRERLVELKLDVRAFLANASPNVVVAEVPTYPRDSSSAAMLWAAYAAIGAIVEASGARWCEMTTSAWRSALGLPPEPSNAPRMPSVVTKEQRKRIEREQMRCSAQAKARRKRSTRDLMLERYPGAPELLASTPASLHEHPFDALAIASAWHRKATQVAPARAQGELAW
jgi:hypothetical protein